MTGAFLRIERNGKMENVEIEYLTKDEREFLFNTKHPDEILNWMDLLCETIRSLEEVPEEEAEAIDDINDLLIVEETEATVVDSEGNIL